MVLQERVPPRTIHRGATYQAERWAEEPFKVLLRTFFSESIPT